MRRPAARARRWTAPAAAPLLALGALLGCAGSEGATACPADRSCLAIEIAAANDLGAIDSLTVDLCGGVFDHYGQSLAGAALPLVIANELPDATSGSIQVQVFGWRGAEARAVGAARVGLGTARQRRAEIVLRPLGAGEVLVSCVKPRLLPRAGGRLTVTGANLGPETRLAFDRPDGSGGAGALTPTSSERGALTFDVPPWDGPAGPAAFTLGGGAAPSARVTGRLSFVADQVKLDPPQSLSLPIGSMAAGDFDEDGRTDLLIDNVQTLDLELWLALPEGGRHAAWAIPDAYLLAAADVDGDGHLDAVTSKLDGTGVDVWRGDGRGGFGQRVTTAVAVLDTPRTGDVDGDGRVDMVVSLGEAPFLQLLRGQADATFRKSDAFPEVAAADAFGFAAPLGLLADADDDGALDVVTEGRRGGLLYLGQGDGTFQAQSLSWGAFLPLVVHDLDGDGRTDVLGAGASKAGGLAAMYGQGQGRFGEPRAWTASTREPLFGDANGDGVADVWLLTDDEGADAPRGVVSVLDGRGGGLLARFEVMEAIYLAVLADLDGDGLADLILSDGKGGAHSTIAFNRSR